MVRRKRNFNRILQVAPMCTRRRARWRHFANAIEPSVCGGDAALCHFHHLLPFTVSVEWLCCLWPPYGIGQAIIFLPCGFFYLLLLLSSFFFSSPNLIRRRLDAYHTSILSANLDAGLKRAARGSLKIQDAKNRQKFAISAPSYNFVGLYLRN